MIVIGYTTGGHGRFLQYITRCYVRGSILLTPFSDNGNSHAQPTEDSHCCSYDLLEDTLRDKFNKAVQKSDNRILTVYPETVEDYIYQLKGSADRVGRLKTSGLQLLEQDVNKYVEATGIKQSDQGMAKQFMENYDIDITSQQAPRMSIRNYYLFLMYTYFNHGIWKHREYLKGFDLSIPVKDVLDYGKVKKFFDGIFDKSLDFEQEHSVFIEKNYALQQANKVQMILDAVESGENMQISDLDVVSEASVCYRLEKKYFDIPFNLGNAFFSDTKEISEYIKHFPKYLKKPNNFFEKYFRYYKKTPD